MYVNTVEDALCDFMKNKIAGKVQLKKSKGGYAAPEVYKGYIMADNAENTDSDAYPFIVVRVIKVFNGTRETNRRRVYARVKIIFGVYCDGLEDGENDLVPQQDGSGHTDLWDLMERTRLELFERMVIGGKVSAEYEDFEMNVIEEQPVPFWHGYIMLTVSMPEIEPSVCYNKNLFKDKN